MVLPDTRPVRVHELEDELGPCATAACQACLWPPRRQWSRRHAASQHTVKRHPAHSQFGRINVVVCFYRRARCPCGVARARCLSLGEQTLWCESVDPAAAQCLALVCGVGEWRRPACAGQRFVNAHADAVCAGPRAGCDHNHDNRRPHAQAMHAGRCGTVSVCACMWVERARGRERMPRVLGETAGESGREDMRKGHGHREK